MPHEAYSEHIRKTSFDPNVIETAPESLRATLSDRLVKPGQGPLQDASFLNAVLDLLRAVLQPKLMFLGTLSADGKRVSTCLTFQDGERAPNFTYTLADSPCATVLGPQSLCIYPDDVATLFPLDRALQKLGARGYVGMPLLDRSGEQIGIIAAVTAHVIGNLDEVRAAFQVFGGRLSLELERAMSGKDDSEAIAKQLGREERRITNAVKRAS